MWIREELKARGKNCFLKNYLPAVAVAVIFMLVGGELGSSFNININLDDIRQSVSHFADTGADVGSVFHISGLFRLVWAGFAGVLGILGILFVIFVKNIFEVGTHRFYMENRERRADVRSVLYGFKNGGYGNTVLALFLRDLYIALWSLLLVIPGIIKSYEYRMVPYILSENPNMPQKRAFEISRQMMDGQKMDTFILDLSFIGWNILSGLTCGVLGIFYVKPYYLATFAELYAVLRAHAFYTGALNSTDLPGYGEADYEYIRK